MGDIELVHYIGPDGAPWTKKKKTFGWTTTIQIPRDCRDECNPMHTQTRWIGRGDNIGEGPGDKYYVQYIQLNVDYEVKFLKVMKMPKDTGPGGESRFRELPQPYSDKRTRNIYHPTKLDEDGQLIVIDKEPYTDYFERGVPDWDPVLTTEVLADDEFRREVTEWFGYRTTEKQTFIVLATTAFPRYSALITKYDSNRAKTIASYPAYADIDSYTDQIRAIFDTIIDDNSVVNQLGGEDDDDKLWFHGSTRKLMMVDKPMFFAKYEDDSKQYSRGGKPYAFKIAVPDGIWVPFLNDCTDDLKRVSGDQNTDIRALARLMGKVYGSSTDPDKMYGFYVNNESTKGELIVYHPMAVMRMVHDPRARTDGAGPAVGQPPPKRARPGPGITAEEDVAFAAATGSAPAGPVSSRRVRLWI